MKKMATGSIGLAATAILAISSPALAQGNENVTLNLTINSYFEFWWDGGDLAVFNTAGNNGAALTGTKVGNLNTNVPVYIGVGEGVLHHADDYAVTIAPELTFEGVTWTAVEGFYQPTFGPYGPISCTFDLDIVVPRDPWGQRAGFYTGFIYVHVTDQ